MATDGYMVAITDERLNRTVRLGFPFGFPLQFRLKTTASYTDRVNRVDGRPSWTDVVSRFVRVRPFAFSGRHTRRSRKGDGFAKGATEIARDARNDDTIRRASECFP